MRGEIKQIYVACIEGDGELFKIGKVTEIPTVTNDEVHGIKEFSGEIEFNVKLTARDILGILGMPTSNNWRKMHGGIMSRKQGKRKKKVKQEEHRSEKEI